MYIAEVGVHPDHGKKGLGRRLVLAIIEQARRKRAECVTLTTFRHVPWNAPFYAKLGFEIIGNPTGYLDEFLNEEAAAGLDRDKRVAMRLTL